MSKKWYEAGSAYKKSAEIFSTQLSSKHEAATSLVDAANCYKKVDVDAATDCFQQVWIVYKTISYNRLLNFADFGWLNSFYLSLFFINFD